MSDDAPADEGGSSPSFETGRYLYCVFDADETPEALSVDGVDDGEPYVVTADGLGAVVQHCEGLYDSDDTARVRRWLLQHQAVVDAAGDRFGTPVPFRFDTVLKGDDARVREWLASQAGTLADALDRVAGKWEYRVDVRCSDDEFGAALDTESGDLAALRSEIEDASDGTAYMKRRQYERQVDQAVAARWTDEMDTLAARLEDQAATVQSVDPSVSTLGDGDERDQADRRTTFALLASPERESAIGDCLEETASKPGVEIRFTGPWPPYSFAPTLEDEP